MSGPVGYPKPAKPLMRKYEVDSAADWASRLPTLISSLRQAINSLERIGFFGVEYAGALNQQLKELEEYDKTYVWPEINKAYQDKIWRPK